MKIGGGLVVRTTGGAALLPGRQVAGAVDLAIAITVSLVDHVLELLLRRCPRPAPRRGRTFSPTWPVISVRSPSKSVVLSPSLSTTRGRYDGSSSAQQHSTFSQSARVGGACMREAGAAPGRDGLLTWLLRQNERDGRLAGWQHACIDGWVDGLT